MPQFFQRTNEKLVVIEGDAYNRLVAEVERLGKFTVGAPLEMIDGPGGIQIVVSAVELGLPRATAIGQILQCVQYNPYKIAFDFPKASDTAS